MGGFLLGHNIQLIQIFFWPTLHDHSNQPVHGMGFARGQDIRKVVRSIFWGFEDIQCQDRAVGRPNIVEGVACCSAPFCLG